MKLLFLSAAWLTANAFSHDGDAQNARVPRSLSDRPPQSQRVIAAEEVHNRDKRLRVLRGLVEKGSSEAAATLCDEFSYQLSQATHWTCELPQGWRDLRREAYELVFLPSLGKTSSPNGKASIFRASTSSIKYSKLSERTRA